MFVLSLGPELWWNGQLTGHALPFATAHALIPGFASLRIAGLLAAGTILPIALLAAIAVDRIIRWPVIAGWRAYLVAGAILALFALEFARVPARLGPPPSNPALHAALAESSHGAIAFVPSGAEFLTPDPFMRRMWWSLNGGRQAMIGGYSGYTPRGTTYLARLVDWTDASNRRLATEALVAFGVRSIVLDRDYLAEPQTEEWQAVIQELRPSARVLDTGRFVVVHLGPDGISSAGDWSDVTVQPVLRAALPDAAIVVPITLQNQTDVPWRPPPGRRTRSGEFHWTTVDGSPSSQQSFQFHVPPLIPANSSAQGTDRCPCANSSLSRSISAGAQSRWRATRSHGCGHSGPDASPGAPRGGTERVSPCRTAFGPESRPTSRLRPKILAQRCGTVRFDSVRAGWPSMAGAAFLSLRGACSWSPG